SLAEEFAVWTNWHSSIPGPTWPNRFFLHLGSSSNLDCSPARTQIVTWAASGFPTPAFGSIFQSLEKAGLKYGLYNGCHDSDNPFNEKYHASNFSDDPSEGGYTKGLGWVPQVASLPGISYDSWYSLKYYLPLHLTKDYDCQYTFIEPNYGNISANTYKGGSS